MDGTAVTTELGSKGFIPAIVNFCVSYNEQSTIASIFRDKRRASLQGGVTNVIRIVCAVSAPAGDRMTTLLSHDAFHDDVGQAFNELLTLHQFATLTAESRLRVLQSLPTDLLQQALNQAMRSDQAEAAKTRAT